ncbi:MAG: SagB/ThcOx family dehydrogenase [Planctomycetota bacterium]|nr:MAG: SagB/ThcOx family dehydrogenase [Planctomycetota bacterium]
MPWSDLWRRRAGAEDREPAAGAPPAPLEIARAYHRVSKHHTHRYADGPGWLDWANQPAPFRTWLGAPRVALQVPSSDGAARYDEVLRGAAREPSAPSAALASELCFDSLAVTAWKQAGDARWALRANPSSGNLHPTELYLALGPEWGLADEPALWHYAPREHALERLATCTRESWRRAFDGCAPGSALLVPTSIPWREAWKYGLRAWRYCQHDLGHALAALGLAAHAQGWRVDELAEAELAPLTVAAGWPARGPERELPDLALVLAPGASSRAQPRLAELEWRAGGARPNELSAEHVDWEAIDALEEALARAPRASAERAEHAPALVLASSPCTRSFRAVARTRRSAVDMDGRTALARAAFERMLAAALPHAAHPAFAALAPPPRAHLLLFVHRVDGLAPGLYFCARRSGAAGDLRARCRPEFEWARVDAPSGIELYRLHAGDMRGVAAALSCQQALAGNGAFSAGMLCELEAGFASLGARAYPRLFRECGALGQVLYLEAEAAGVRATGIGCFFDDGVHALLGMRDEAWQSLYHFAVGAAIDDARLTTLPAYPTPEGAAD